MKMTKKKVFVAALAVCLVAILSLGTLAWFNADDEVTNKFMVASSEDEADKIFSVDLWETEIGEDGLPTNEKTDEGNTYNNIYPSEELLKDPTVENTGLYDQWIRLNVTLSDAETWAALLGKYGIDEIESIFGGYDGNVWRSEGNEDPVFTDDGSATFTYYLNYKLAPGNIATLFTSVTIPEEFTQEDMATINAFEMHIVAEALQADNTGDDCYEAFEKYWE